MAKKLKTVEVTLPVEQPKSMWRSVKDWFYNAWSVFLAYVYGLIGAAIGVVGLIDWSPMLTLFQTSTNFTNKQLMGIGASVVGGAVALYIARVQGTKEVNGHLLPKAATK